MIITTYSLKCDAPGCEKKISEEGARSERSVSDIRRKAARAGWQNVRISGRGFGGNRMKDFCPEHAV